MWTADWLAETQTITPQGDEHQQLLFKPHDSRLINNKVCACFDGRGILISGLGGSDHEPRLISSLLPNSRTSPGRVVNGYLSVKFFVHCGSLLSLAKS